MRFFGNRRALGLITLLTIATLAAIGWSVKLRVDSTLRNLGPLLIARAQEALGREIQVDRLTVDRPGIVLLEGLRVARGKKLAEGEFLTARRAEITYNPALLAWRALMNRGAGMDSRAMLRAQDVQINEPAPYPAGPLLYTETLSTRFDLAPLFQKQGELLATVPDVELGSPRVRVARDPQGHWSFEHLFRRKPNQKPIAFRGTIHARGAHVEFIDYLCGSLPAPARNAGTADVEARFAAYPAIDFSALGRVAGAQGGTVQVRGNRDTQTRRWFVSVQGDSENLPYWYRYFSKATDALRIQHASGSVAASAWSPNGTARQFHLELNIRRGTATLAALGVPVQDYRGRVTVDPSAITLDGDAVGAGMPVRLSGEVLRNAAALTGMRFRLRSDRVTLAALKAIIPGFSPPRGITVPVPSAVTCTLVRSGMTWDLKGIADLPQACYREAVLQRVHGTFAARFTGDHTPAVYSGILRAPIVRYRATTATNLVGTYRVADRALQADGAFDVAGGHVKGRGWVKLAEGDDGAQYFTGTASGVEIGKLPFGPENTRVAGIADGEFAVAGGSTGLESSATVHIAPLFLNGEMVEEVRGRVQWGGDRLEIPYASIHDHRLNASVAGSVTREGELDLQIAANDVELAQALAGRVKDPIAGRAIVAARVTGTAEAPAAEGRVQVYEPRWREHNADYVEAQFAIKWPTTVQLSAVKLNRVPLNASAERLMFTRIVETDAPWSIAGTVDVDGLSIVRAMELAGVSDERLKKNAVGGDLEPIHLTLSGPISAPAIRFATGSRRVAFQGLDLGEVRAAGTVDIEAQRLSLERLTTHSSTLAASVSGSLGFDLKAAPDQFAERATADLEFNIHDVDLLPLVRRYEPDLLKTIRLRGRVQSASGRVAGRVLYPEVTARLALADLALNEQAVTLAPLQARWTPAGVVVRHVEAQVGPGRVTAPYAVLLLDGAGMPRRLPDRVAGSVEVDGLPVQLARQMLERSPAYGSRMPQALQNAAAQWGDDLAGRITLHASIAGPDPALSDEELVALVEARHEAAVLKGDVTIPDLDLASDGGRSRAQLTAGFTYANGLLTVRQAEVVRERGGVLRLAGTYREKNASAPDHLDITGSIADLRVGAVVRLATGNARERLASLRPLDGTIALQASIRGRSEKPEVAFSLDVSQPVLGGLPFDALSIHGGEYSAAAGTLKVASAELLKHRAQQSDARILLTGSLPLAWPELTIPADAPRNLTVTLPEQPLAALNDLANDADARAQAAGEAESRRIQEITRVFRRIAATDGEMGGQVTLGGTANAPRNSGQVTLTNATLRLGGLQTQVRDFNATLRLSGSELTFERFGGRSSQGGDFSVTGSVILGRQETPTGAAELKLALDVRTFRFSERKIGELAGQSFEGSRAEGTLQSVDPGSAAVKQPIAITGPWKSPSVRGALLLDNATTYLAIRDAPDRERPSLPLNPALDVKLIAGKNVWLRNQQVRLKLDDSVSVFGTLQAPLVRGDLRVSRGTMNLPTIRLRNVEGTLRVSYDGSAEQAGLPAPPPAYVDLIGTTTLRIQRSAAVETEYYDATFEIRGTPGGGQQASSLTSGGSGLSVGSPGGLVLTVRTDPPLPNSDIEALIRQQLGVEGFGGNGANVVEALRGQIEQAFTANVASALTGKIEDAVQSALGLDIFSIDLGITQPLRIRLGKRLFGNLYGTVSQEFSTGQSQSTLPDQRQYELYYRLTPRFRIGYREETPLNRKTLFFSGTLSF